jgi:hypothetical protein
MTFKEPKNKNYCAIVTKVETFVDLSNCDNVKHAVIFGYRVVVSKDTEAGTVGLFFPAETALSAEFLSNNNLYRKPEFGNVNPEKAGFFEQHGRVKTMKFRGHRSEGFWIPLTSLEFLGVPLSEFEIGSEFDEVNGVEICRKYVTRNTRTPGQPNTKKATKKLADRIAAEQFRFHYDTANLRRNSHKIFSENTISISEKWHGTSIIVSNLLINKELSWFEKVARFVGIPVVEKEYGIVWSSRKVVKGVSEWTNNSAGSYYSSDIYSVVKDEVKDRLPKGFTLYGEIVGFTPDGGNIQGGYYYGCVPNQHKFVVYRVTFTNVDGKVVELSWPQMIEFCQSWGFETVPTVFYGKASELLPNTFSDVRDWQEAFVTFLEETYVDGKKCWFNEKLPAEGIVIRKDRLEQAEAYKLKSFEFLKKESEDLDKGVADMESEEVVEE